VFRKGTIVLGFALLAMLVIAAAANASSSGNSPGAVYTLTNSPAGNAVIAFDRSADGSLSPQGTFATGGTGSGGGLGSQGSVALTADGRQLLAVNAGSNSVSLFGVRPDGLDLEATVPSGGALPISVTVHDKLAYVLNAGGTGNIAGFLLDHDGLAALSGSSQPLGAGSAGPAQVAFTPDGGALVVTEKSSSTIDTYAVGADGRAAAPVVSPSAGGTPFGFDFDNRGHLLVSEAAGSASSYALSGSGATVISGGFALGQDGSLALLDPSGVTASLGATSHPLDEAFSNDGQFLYNLTDGSHVISAFRLGADGSLTFAGSTPVPAGAAGLAAQ
jgi:6-phosphogluconolactonase